MFVNQRYKVDVGGHFMPVRLHPLARRHSFYTPYTLYTPYSCYGSTGHACYIPAPFSS